MTEEELIEKLAEKEHASWARWMEYLFSRCTRNQDGSFTIFTDFSERWARQIATPYSDLSEEEKQSDREEVAHILPIIEEYRCQKSIEHYTTTLKWVENNGTEHTFQSQSENEVYTKGSELLADYLLCKIRNFSIEAPNA